ncbi:acetate/propionate family kinase [Limnoglobus roseus]|uniref:Acetate kinase n=1 Tax=Limnoglobus roseus TaxID=2598579 RepID=A0A5C1ADT9_9BACT|nr:acetate/propionate family kinase [Limnoglobus roseus]QEL16815.1 acetate/propionate family kinase [Limnoglobus roseus]
MPVSTAEIPSSRLSVPGGHVLTLNGGSSSIKFAVFDAGESLRRSVGGAVERVGLADAFLRASMPGRPDERRPLPAAGLDQAVEGLFDWLDGIGALRRISAVGHRIVHGGPSHTDPRVITPGLLADLRAATPFAPVHLPSEIRLIEALARRLPGVPQFACFDTAFHRDLSSVARFLPIPRRYRESGIRRYGFHGLSYDFLLGEVGRLAGADAARGRVVLAHLGSGASMAAVRDGRCVDTTMGLTPAGGLVMGTRTGDLDPGVLIHIAKAEGLTADQLEDLVTRRSGLLGVSETSPDMRDLLARQATDPRAADAVELFCYQARKWVGALSAALGGLDTLVFSGGIGEGAPEVRSRVCDGLEFLGVRLDSAANDANAPLISATAGPVTVRVIPTDEELMIARTVFRVAGAGPPAP